MLGWIVFIVILQAIVYGAFYAYLASEKKRAGDFGLFLGIIALIALLGLPDSSTSDNPLSFTTSSTADLEPKSEP